MKKNGHLCSKKCGLSGYIWKDKWMDRPNNLFNFRMSGNLNLMMEQFKPTGC